jgi:biuret amidohydrolase
MTEHEKIQEMVRQKDELPLTLERAKSAMLIIDVQRHFTKPDHPFGRVFDKLMPGAADGYFKRVKATVLPNIKRLQECFRSQALPVIFCGGGGYLADGRDLPEFMRDWDKVGLEILGCRMQALVGDPGWDFDDEIAPLTGEMVLNKSCTGALSSTKLDQILHNMGVNSLVVCGLTTAVCVSQTAREFVDRGFRVLLVGDACTELSEEMHRAALFTFSYCYGRVKTTEETIRYFASAPNTSKNETCAA